MEMATLKAIQPPSAERQLVLVVGLLQQLSRFLSDHGVRHKRLQTDHGLQPQAELSVKLLEPQCNVSLTLHVVPFARQTLQTRLLLHCACDGRARRRPLELEVVGDQLAQLVAVQAGVVLLLHADPELSLKCEVALPQLGRGRSLGLAH